MLLYIVFKNTMDFHTILILIVSIIYLIVLVAVILAIFSIRDNAKIQTELLQEQSRALRSIHINSFLLLKKNVSKVQVRKFGSGSGEIKVMELSDWLKENNVDNMYTVENVD